MFEPLKPLSKYATVVKQDAARSDGSGTLCFGRYFDHTDDDDVHRTTVHVYNRNHQTNRQQYNTKNPSVRPVWKKALVGIRLISSGIVEHGEKITIGFTLHRFWASEFLYNITVSVSRQNSKI